MPPATGTYAFAVDGNIPHILSVNGKGTPITYKHENPPAPPRLFDLKENDLVQMDLTYWADEGDVEVAMELLSLRKPSATAFLSYSLLGTPFCLQMNWLGEYITNGKWAFQRWGGRAIIIPLFEE